MEEAVSPHGCRCGRKEQAAAEKPLPANEEFQPSELGTKEYWDRAYERELQSFHDSGDVGEIWFGEASMDRVITWLETQKFPKDTALLDIGTGNGVFLLELAKAGFTNLTGIDNSSSAVKLAKAIAEKEEVLSLKLQVADFLHPFPNLSRCEICVDKGTFDAISLSPDHPAEKQSFYRQSLRSVLKDGGLFLITSCNWTKEELANQFSEGFEMLQELPTPRFQFGGKSGNTVTTLVFKRKE